MKHSIMLGVQLSGSCTSSISLFTTVPLPMLSLSSACLQGARMEGGQLVRRV